MCRRASIALQRYAATSALDTRSRLLMGKRYVAKLLRQSRYVTNMCRGSIRASWRRRSWSWTNLPLDARASPVPNAALCDAQARGVGLVCHAAPFVHIPRNWMWAMLAKFADNTLGHFEPLGVFSSSVRCGPG